MQGYETVESPAKPKSAAAKKAPTPKKSPRKKRSASEAMDDGDGDNTGSPITANNSPSEKVRNAVKKIKDEIKEEQAVEDEVGLSITIKAQKPVEERTTATNTDGQTAGNDAVSDMRAESEQFKPEDTAPSQISPEILGHLAAHRFSPSATGASLSDDGLDSVAVTVKHEEYLSIAPFGYGQVGVGTQTQRRRSTTVYSVHDPREADLAVDQFVNQLELESHEADKRGHRQDEKVFVA